MLVLAGTTDITLLEPATRAAPFGDPAPLTADEEASPALETLARRFNPSMAFTTPEVWPVDVRYIWQDGADLRAEVLSRSGRVLRDYVAVPHRELDRRSWADLPARDPDGNGIRYGVDGPGDDELTDGRTNWMRRWQSLAGPATRGEGAPTDSPFPPTQYAHFYWADRARGLLGVQYWFFYPFNDWINHHEGDWEHVNILLRGPSSVAGASADAFHPVAYQFFFHGFRVDAEDVVRVGGARPEDDHVVVFTGGRGSFLGWGGTHSGASYPLPGLWPGAGSGPFKPDEDVSRPARFIHARDFRVIVLPEPERLDASRHPTLSWLKLDFYAGQRHVSNNPPLVDRLGYGAPTRQPARRPAWNAVHTKPPFGALPTIERDLVLPADWSVLGSPRLARTAALP